MNCAVKPKENTNRIPFKIVGMKIRGSQFMIPFLHCYYPFEDLFFFFRRDRRSNANEASAEGEINL